MNRSEFIFGTLAAVSTPPPADFARIEARTGGRLGVAALDTASGRTMLYRPHERFPMCSTFKLLAAAAILTRVDRGDETLTREVKYGKADLLQWAPVTGKHVAEGSMTLEALCAAAIEYSDNTAANLLLATLGGPGAVTEYARSIGDGLTTLDRTEPTLNTAIPGDSRDTTTPSAMAADVQKIVLGNVLSSKSKALLASWLAACKTGDTLLRTGLPKNWQTGDKTGNGGPKNRYGDNDTRNDIAITTPPGRAPIVIAAYLTQCQVRAQERDAALADVARTVVAYCSSS